MSDQFCYLFETWFEMHTEIDLNYRNMIFGFDSEPLINLYLILIKMVIYNSRFKKQTPLLCDLNTHDKITNGR